MAYWTCIVVVVVAFLSSALGGPLLPADGSLSLAALVVTTPAGELTQIPASAGGRATPRAEPDAGPPLLIAAPLPAEIPVVGQTMGPADASVRVVVWGDYT